MKKRILSIVLALVLLIGVAPTAVITASAASRSISEGGITILKQLEGYQKNCFTKGTATDIHYIGYGTVCTAQKPHEATKVHSITEKEADTALRAELKELDKAVNTFASNNGLNLTQSKHDALVLFSFQNGTAWMNGTGDLRTAVIKGFSGSKFLTAMCDWSAVDNNERRMIETNMYLYGRYSSSAPDTFIQVKLDTNGGTIPEYVSGTPIYYDLNASTAVGITPTKSGCTFMGWYKNVNGQDGNMITNLTTAFDNQTLTARWQTGDGINAAYYQVNVSDLASETIYNRPNKDAKKTELSKYITNKKVTAYGDYVDAKGVRWILLASEDGNPDGWQDWVALKIKVGGGTASNVGTSTNVTVTVTNSYVNTRAEATIHSTKLGTFTLGKQLRIINTHTADGFLWGQVAKSETDDTPVCWIALRYTNYESVKNTAADTTTSETGTAVARATVKVNGYVNVRNGAGTDNQIVSSLANGTVVDLYEIKYVNGIRWGRSISGWFCLNYASVTMLTEQDSSTDVGLTAYAFTGSMAAGNKYYSAPSYDSDVNLVEKDQKTIFTNLTLDSKGVTWAKATNGYWFPLADENGNNLKCVELDVAKYQVIASSVAVRKAAGIESDRIDTLVKGVEFNVNSDQYSVVVVGESVWGYADKVGEKDTTYGGWVNLASKYVTRNNAPDLTQKDENTDSYTGKIATVVNTDTVRVRLFHALYAKQVGTLTRGTQAKVLQEADGWYELDIDVDNDPSTGSWVYGQYLQISEGTINSGNTGNTGSTGGTTVSTSKTGTGIIANTYTGVNVRTAPGTGNKLVCKILPGTSVNILEVTKYGAAEWGRVEQGWICMDYVTMISYEDIPGGNGSANGGSTVTGSQVAIYTGKAAKNGVIVYKTTYDSSDAVRVDELKQGDPVTVHELLAVSRVVSDENIDKGEAGTENVVTTITEYWARVNDGYIKDPGENITLDSLDEVVYTVTESDTLNVRPSVGQSGDPVAQLKRYDQVKITRVQILRNDVWGFMETEDMENNGWICLSYTTRGAVTAPQANQPTTPTQPDTGNTGTTGSTGATDNKGGYLYTGTVINTGSLNVRATASQTAAKTTTLKGGAALVIYETTISEGMAWGRCDAGWVYLYYVDLTPSSGTAIDAKVVYRDNTIAYTDSNGTEVAGTYAKMSVVNIYEVIGKMARTDLGWICTDNLLN